MNLFKKFYCRTFQTVFKLALPILPYREPTILKTNDEVVETLKSNKIDSVLLVTDKGIRSLNLTQQLENKVVESGIKLSVYDGVVANPTTDNVAEALNIYKDIGI